MLTHSGEVRPTVERNFDCVKVKLLRSEVFTIAKVKLFAMLTVKYGQPDQVKLSLPTLPQAKLHYP